MAPDPDVVTPSTGAMYSTAGTDPTEETRKYSQLKCRRSGWWTSHGPDLSLPVGSLIGSVRYQRVRSMRSPGTPRLGLAAAMSGCTRIPQSTGEVGAGGSSGAGDSSDLPLANMFTARILLVASSAATLYASDSVG